MDKVKTEGQASETRPLDRSCLYVLFEQDKDRQSLGKDRDWLECGYSSMDQGRTSEPIVS